MVAVNVTVIAQENSTTRFNDTEKYYKWSIGMQLYSPEKLNPVATDGNGISESGHYFAGTDLKEKTFFSYGIIVNYNINKDFIVRLRVGKNNRKITQYYNTGEGTSTPTNPTPGSYQIGEATIKQSAQRFGLGLQRTFHLNKFGAYAGLEFQYINYNHFYLNYATTDVQDTVKEITTGAWDIPGGFLAGAGPYIGFNYYFMKRISIGAEISFVFQYMKLGGNAYGGYDSPVSSFWETQRHTVEKVGFDNVKTLFSISYYFRNKQSK